MSFIRRIVPQKRLIGKLDTSMNFRLWLESFVDDLVMRFRVAYPGIELSAYENADRIELQNIKVPKLMQGQGIGSLIIKAFQRHAMLVNKPIVIRPSPEQGKKGALMRFYKRHGFVVNTGRRIDFTLSSPTAKTMYWRSSFA